jgi:hypothetical protein
MRIIVTLLVALALFCAPLLAQAGEIKLIGIVEHIKMTDKNAKQADMVVKDKAGKIHRVVLADAQNLE